MPPKQPIRNPYKRKSSKPLRRSLTFTDDTSLSARSALETHSLSSNVHAHTTHDPGSIANPHGADSPSYVAPSTPPSTRAVYSTPPRRSSSSGAVSSPISIDGDSFCQMPEAGTAFYEVVTTPEKGSPSRDELRSDLNAERASRSRTTPTPFFRSPSSLLQLSGDSFLISGSA